MNRILSVGLMIALIAACIILPNTQTARAASNAEPGIPAPANFIDYLRVKAAIPFVWLRTEPYSYAPVNNTVYPSSEPSLSIYDRTPRWDGHQWWWHVGVIPRENRANGWVEQGSVEPASFVPYPTVVPIDRGLMQWKVPKLGRIQAGIPFIWIRSNPNSYASNVHTVWSNGVFMIVGAPVPSWDGAQWWWAVTYFDQRAWQIKTGWVEQNSITLR